MSRLRQWLLIPACALPLLLAPPPAFSGFVRRVPKREFRHQVDALEQQWRMATLNGDFDTLDRLLSDDYVGISWNGQINTKTSQINRLRSHALVFRRLDLSNLKVKMIGTVAIVTCRAQVEGSNDGVDIEGAFLYTRIYQRLPSGVWKITNFEATRIPQRQLRSEAQPQELR